MNDKTTAMLDRAKFEDDSQLDEMAETPSMQRTF